MVKRNNVAIALRLWSLPGNLASGVGLEDGDEGMASACTVPTVSAAGQESAR